MLNAKCSRQHRPMAKKWGVQINSTKTTSSEFSLSPKKEAVKLTLEGKNLPQTETPSFLGVNLDTRLTWRPQVESMERKSIRRLAVMKKLAGTSWGGNTDILKQVYTATVRPCMEYASTSWDTAAKTTKEKLDKVQNMGLRIMLGTLKSTPIKFMEKVSNVEPLQNRRNRKILLQTEKIRRLPSHPLHSELGKLTKNRIKRKSLNHLSRSLQRRYADCLPRDPSPSPLSLPELPHKYEASPIIHMEIPGIASRNQSPHVLKALSLELIESRYPSESWVHVYTDGSSVKAVRNGGSGFYIIFPDGTKVSQSVPGGTRCTNFKAEILAIKSSADYLTDCKKNIGSIVFLTDSMSAIQALNSRTDDPSIYSLLSSVNRLSQKASTVIQWIPAHVGLPGNERADQLAKIGSTLEQPESHLSFTETKSQLHSFFKREYSATHDGYSATKDPIWTMERIQQTTLTRLRCGHCRLKYHMSKLGITESGKCDCGFPEQTPSHILQTCPLFSENRKKWWPEETPLETKLWGSKSDLLQTVGFITSIGLAI